MSSSKKDYLEIIKHFSNNERVIYHDLEMLLKFLLEEGKNSI